MKRPKLQNVLPAALLAGGLLFNGGCATTGEFGDRTAVVVYNQKPEKIIDVSTQVFVSQGFSTISSSEEEAVYERKGTTMQNMAYGSWMEGGIWEKATLKVEPYGQGSSLLEAKIVRVSNKNDDFFAESKPMSKRARKPFQELLNKIASQLNGMPPVNDAN